MPLKEGSGRTFSATYQFQLAYQSGFVVGRVTPSAPTRDRFERFAIRNPNVWGVAVYADLGSMAVTVRPPIRLREFGDCVLGCESPSLSKLDSSGDCSVYVRSTRRANSVNQSDHARLRKGLAGDSRSLLSPPNVTPRFTTQTRFEAPC